MEIREPSEVELRQWNTEIETASKRTLEVRMKYAFINTYRPVLNDERINRSFESMEEHRECCEAKLSEWLGYYRVKE